MTTYRSQSRGFMYTAPPSGDETDENVRDGDRDAADAESDATDDGSPDLEPTTAATDANWTGTVPTHADD